MEKMDSWRTGRSARRCAIDTNATACSLASSSPNRLSSTNQARVYSTAFTDFFLKTPQLVALIMDSVDSFCLCQSSTNGQPTCPWLIPEWANHHFERKENDVLLS
ncbi:Metal tolerance protein 10 [Fusarium oxysporum f. sp. albedinis]|nr:Metal tolerance protein 10 [Fusarium oxysporum f. sp. albedinis]